MFEWNNLKSFLASAHNGSTLGAKALGVNQSTLEGRPAELEKRLRYP